MKNLNNKITMTTLALTIVLSLSNCEAIKNANNKQKGAVIGTAGGALIGAILGNNIGKDEYNMTLSEKRALSVTDYLMSKGLVKNRFQTLWYGEMQPKYDNTTAEGRAKNRRVNVAIVPNDKMVNDAKIESGGK